MAGLILFLLFSSPKRKKRHNKTPKSQTMQLQIGRRGHAVLLAEGPVEGGVVIEAPLPIDLPHGGAPQRGVAAGGQAALEDVLMDR